MLACMRELLLGLPPIARTDARTLILGSMPSARSLSSQQYYAHARNRFWPLMGRLVGAGPELGYADRCARLQQRGIAVWDVVAQCRRLGSLDSAIEPDSIVINDFMTFLKLHPGLRRIAFNGALARRSFARHVPPEVLQSLADLTVLALPSTSPANASYSLERLFNHWQALTADAPESRDSR